MNKSLVSIVLLSLAVLVNAQCSCQTKPPVDVKYQGEACECGRHYPVQMEVPKITEHRDAHYDYGFTIERPQQSPAEVKYTFDFHMEKPKPLQTASLATYGFDVETPVQKEVEVPQRYSFDYQLQTPVVKSGPSNLQGLMAHVDRIVIQKKDCEEKNGCKCNSYKPTIDLLQRCPKHGHLYRYGGTLFPIQQRYNKDSFPVQAPTSSDRSKRNVANTFPIKIKELLPELRPNNQILKVPSMEEENRNRMAEILKKNFGEDPTENIDELLRPKPLGSVTKMDDKEEKAHHDFIARIKPKLEEANNNFRERIAKIVNKARLDAIKAKSMIQKRSTESNLHELLPDGNFDGSYEPIWITDESVEEYGTENTINDPKNSNDEDETSSGDRIRKHCERCGELAKKFPCPSCGAIPSEGSINQGTTIRYVTKQTATPSRYVFDRFGRQYVENNGNIKEEQAAPDVTVGSYHNQPAYGELQDILAKNSAAMYSQNRGVAGGHLVQPMNFEHASDAIRFIQELTQRNNNGFNEDYYSNGNSYEVGASSPNFHAKRSFKIVPLAEKDDGSVFVKISPIGNSKPKVNEKSAGKPADYAKYYKDDESKLMLVPKIDEKNLDKEKPKANFEKFVRNGKKYEILSLNGSDERSVGSEEDLEILKYIYAVNQKGHARDDVSDEILDKNESTNIDAQVET